MTKLTADACRRLLQQKTIFLWEKLWLFVLFSGDKGYYFGVWMIKLRSKQIDIDACFFQMYITYTQTTFVLNVQLFPSAYWRVNLTLTDKHGTENV